MRQWTGSSLVQIMACCLCSAKPYPVPKLTYCQLDPQEQTIVNFKLDCRYLDSVKCSFKMSYAKWQSYCPGLSWFIKSLVMDIIFHLWLSWNVRSTIQDHTLTHWGPVTQICVGKLTIIDSDNGLSPRRRQTIIWTNAGILLIGSLGTNFNEILIGIQTFLFKKMHLKLSSAKCRPFCLGLSVLIDKSQNPSSFVGFMALFNHSWLLTFNLMVLDFSIAYHKSAQILDIHYLKNTLAR